MFVGVLALALVLPCRAEQSRKEWLERRIPEISAELKSQLDSLLRSRAELGIIEGRNQMALNEALVEELGRRGFKRSRVPSWRARVKAAREAEPRIDLNRQPLAEEAGEAMRWLRAVEELSQEMLQAISEALRRRLLRLEPFKSLGAKLKADIKAHMARYGPDDIQLMAIDMTKHDLTEKLAEYRALLDESGSR